MGVKVLPAKKPVTIYMVFLLSFPLFCLVLLAGRERRMEYLWPLPSRWDMETIFTDGLFILWPLAAALVWMIMRSDWCGRAVRLVFSKANLRVGWKLALLLLLLQSVITFFKIRYGIALRLLLTVLLLGVYGSTLFSREFGQRVHPMKIGWGISWRMWVFHACFGAVFSLSMVLMLYVMMAPVLALIDMVEGNTQSIREMLGSLGSTAPYLKWFMYFYGLVNFSLMLGAFSFASIFLIPGMAFWSFARNVGIRK